jgi:hypothetical protein
MRLLLATLLISPIAIPAQSKYDLTGKPDATLQESFTQVAGVRELPGNRAIVTDQAERTTCTIRKAHTSAEPHSRCTLVSWDSARESCTSREQIPPMIRCIWNGIV